MSAEVRPLTWRPAISLAERFRTIRLAYGRRVSRKVKQEEFAAIIHVGAPAYSSWESGRARPAHLEAIAYQIERYIGSDAAFLIEADSPDGGAEASRGSAHPENDRSVWTTVTSLFDRVAA